MIRFACPRCKSQFQVPDDRAGSKTACPRCQQRLQIPAPPPAINQTVLAPLVNPPPPPQPPARPPVPPVSPPATVPVARMAQPVPPPVAQVVPPVPVAHVATPQEEALPETHARPGRQLPRKARRLLLVAGVLLLLFVGGLGVRLVLTGGYVGSPGKTAENRSHTRLSEEELVKRFILNNAEDVAEVTFLTWGPHLLSEEMAEIEKEIGPLAKSLSIVPLGGLRVMSPDLTLSVVRARYRLVAKKDVAGAKSGEIGLSDLRKGESRVCDELFTIAGQAVFPCGDGMKRLWGLDPGGSDDWKVKFRKELAKSFPAIGP